MLRFIPAPLHRAMLPMAHRARHHWRRIFRLPVAGVSLVIVDEQDRLLLVRHSYGRPVWALPGGGLGRGEDPEQAARREMREELGCDPLWIGLAGIVRGTISGAPHSAHVFAASITGDFRPDGREVITAQFFALDALPEDISRYALRDLAIWREGRSVLK
jgi:ADP-ribose pyrophosphatase YjhB (NUDIX family)